MSKKKILFVYPSSYDSRHRLIKSRKSFVPSRTLPYLAALTPKRYETHIVDELVDNLNFDVDIDLVALTGMLSHMPRAIDIAREFRKCGKPAIIGGVGAFAIRDEIEKSGAFESFVVGEADELWKTVLDDFNRGGLKRYYECTHYPQLKGLPPARFDLLSLRKYMKSFWDRKHPVIPIETSRGCPHNCSFCLTTRYFGKRMRYRPIGEVVEEVKYHGAKFVMFTDDNIAINPVRARELFLAIKPLGIHWFAQFESSVAEHPELLRLAAESGCRSALVGIESLVCDNLHSINKPQNTKLDIKEIAKSFRKVDISLFASIIFGMDNDTPEVIKCTVEQLIANDVDIMVPWMLTPFHGTFLHDDCKREGRLIHENYSLYDCLHPVMRPKQMTSEELEESFWQGLKRFYSLRHVLLRVWQKKRYRTPAFLYGLYFHRKIRKGLHPLAGNS